MAQIRDSKWTVKEQKNKVDQKIVMPVTTKTVSVQCCCKYSRHGWNAVCDKSGIVTNTVW